MTDTENKLTKYIFLWAMAACQKVSRCER